MVIKISTNHTGSTKNEAQFMKQNQISNYQVNTSIKHWCSENIIINIIVFMLSLHNLITQFCITSNEQRGVNIRLYNVINCLNVCSLKFGIPSVRKWK